MPAQEIVNLLEEAGALSVAYLIEDIDCIVSVIDSNRNRVSGLPRVITQSLSQVVLNCEPWVLYEG
jgi:hypothetical protein